MRLFALGILLVLLGGCGDDKPAYYQSSASPANASQRATAPPAAPTPAADAAPDPLLSGGDPLTKGADSLTPDSSGDAMQGPKMPTQHSHWLTGRIRSATVTVRLNGFRLGDYYSLLDKDITMKLRAGVNTITFDYTPRDMTSSAHLDVLESEHTPPIAPLATFRSPQLSADSKPQAISQTYTFVAN